MSIEHTCQCGAKLKVKDELAGKKIKCPKCSVAFTLPVAQAAPELISVSCKCGKAFQAKASMSGIGLLTQHDWGVTVGQIAASMYFVLALIDILYFFLAGSTDGVLFQKNYLLFGVQYLSTLVGYSIAPALLLYVTFRESNRQ